MMNEYEDEEESVFDDESINSDDLSISSGLDGFKASQEPVFLTDMLENNEKSDKLEFIGPDLDDNEKGGLQSLVSSLTKDKRTKYQEINELNEENELNLQSGAQLTLASLLPDSNQKSEVISHLNKLEKAGYKLDTKISRSTRQKANRKVAYEQNKKAISKFQPQVNTERMKKTVDFTDPEVFKTTVDESNDVFEQIKSSKHKISKLQAQINNILSKNGVESEENIIKSEIKGLQEQKLSKKDIEKRRNDILKLKSLMFYCEKKNKRIKKIKSKTFRKHKRKRDLKEGKGGKELDEEELALRRARERVTLRHKNNSRFVKGLLRHSGMKRDRYRDVIEAQLRKEQELRLRRKKMFTNKNISDSEGSSSDSEGENESEVETKGSSLINMNFMKKAEKRKIEEIQRQGNSIDGRRKIIKKDNEIIKELEKERDIVESKENPWLSMKKIQEDEDSLRKNKRKGYKINDIEFEVDRQPISILKKSAAAIKIKVTKKSKERANEKERGIKVVSKMPNDEDTKEGESEDKRPKELTEKEKAFKLLKQSFMIVGATRDEFLEEKQLEAEEEARRREASLKKDPSNLPGWGSWTGIGVNDKKKRQKARIKVPVRSKVIRKTLVINEEENLKKLAKFQVDRVPFPYRSRREYERSLLTPIGSDWNTLSAHEELIKPEVLRTQGMIIKPIDYKSDK